MATTTIHGRQLRLGTISQDRIDAAFQQYLTSLENSISSLGAAFNYVGSVEGGADAGSAFSLDSLTEKDTGDYYKVATGGYFTSTAGGAIYANSGDGLVFNMSGSVDIIDNTNSDVAGTAQFIAVTGSKDTGFVVDLDQAFKDRIVAAESAISTLQSNLSALEALVASEVARLEGLITAEQAAREAADQALTDALAAEQAAREAADSALDVRVTALESEVAAIDPRTMWVRTKVGAAGVTGVIDDVNQAFVLAETPVTGTLQVHLNGVLQEPAEDYAYDPATKTVTMVEAPLVLDKITFMFYKQV
jgi:hypothetical protein